MKLFKKRRFKLMGLSLLTLQSKLNKQMEMLSEIIKIIEGLRKTTEYHFRKSKIKKTALSELSICAAHLKGAKSAGDVLTKFKEKQ